MRRLLPFLLLAGCAHHPSHVRDPEGRSLPTTARLDADTNGTELHCPRQGTYWIVEPPPPYMTGNHLGTAQVVVTDAPRLCAAIRAADR